MTFDKKGGVRIMKRHGKRVNETLAKVVERYNFHQQEMKSVNPLIAEAAVAMCNIELWELWSLTQ